VSNLGARTEALSAGALEQIEEIAVRHSKRQGALLPILHDIQDAFGFIPSEAVPVIAGILNLSRAEVHGTISFYHDFREHPAGKPVVKLCRAEACKARGVEAIAPLLEQDGRVEVETVYCLGLCASGPSAMIGERVFARLSEVNIARLADEALA
jgi:formate dehydrogenase subunit gamma